MSWKVPFDEEGNHMTYDGYAREEDMRDNFVFKAELQYVGFTRGRSSLNITWMDTETEKFYSSGMSLLHEILSGQVDPEEHKVHLDGRIKIKGEFTFKKQGTSVLLKTT